MKGLIENSKRCAAVLAVLLPLASAPAASAEPVSQGEWARLLVEAMGVAGEIAPGAPADRDFIDFLSGEPAPVQRVWASSSMPFPAGASKVPDPIDADRLWIRAGAQPITARYRVNVAHPGIYALRFRGQGTDQRWQVGGGGIHTGRPTSKGGAESATDRQQMDLLGYFVLPRGGQTVTVEIPAGGSLLLFELLRQPFPHVRPPGGWRPDAPLTFGDKAVTMIQAMELEHELPDVAEWRVEREGERFDREAEPGLLATREEGAKPSAGAWLKGAAEGSRVAYLLPLAKRGTYSLIARVTGGGIGRLLLNDLVERGWRGPRPEDRLEWRNLATLPLEEGMQRIDVALAPGAGLDVMRLIYRDPSPEASLLLLEDLGFEEAAPGDLVSAAAAAENLRSPEFQNRVKTLLAGFYTQPGTGIGPPSGAPVISPPGLVLTGEDSEITPVDSSPQISP